VRRLGFQTERHRIHISVTSQVVTVAPNHADKSPAIEAVQLVALRLIHFVWIQPLNAEIIVEVRLLLQGFPSSAVRKRRHRQSAGYPRKSQAILHVCIAIASTSATACSFALRACVSQVVSILPSKGAGKVRTQIACATRWAAVGSAKVQIEPAKVTLYASSVNVASQLSLESLTAVRSELTWRRS
jgi:hypothetical protein